MIEEGSSRGIQIAKMLRILKLMDLIRLFFGSYVESLVLLDKATKGVVTY